MLKRSFFLLTVLLLLFTVGCASDTPEYSFTEEYVSAIEPYSLGWILEGIVPSAKVDSRVYYFDDTLPEDDRNSFISAQEELCKLTQKHEISADGMTFYVLADGENHANSAKTTAYLSADPRS